MLESIPFPLRNSLDEVVTLLAHSAHDKGLELTLSIKNDVPITSLATRCVCNEVITNLVGNAIKFTENGNIDVLVEQRAISNNKVQIEVQIAIPGSVFLNAISRACFEHFVRPMPASPAAMAVPVWGW